MAWQLKTVTPKEYYFLASHKFPTRGSLLPNWHVVDSQNFYQQGLLATSYAKEAHSQLVIAFIMLAKNPITQDILNSARDFACHAKAYGRRMGLQVSYTGRKAGGSVAELCAVEDKLPAHTFDSLSICDEYHSQFIETMGGYHDNA